MLRRAWIRRVNLVVICTKVTLEGRLRLGEEIQGASDVYLLCSANCTTCRHLGPELDFDRELQFVVRPQRNDPSSELLQTSTSFPVFSKTRDRI